MEVVATGSLVVGGGVGAGLLVIWILDAISGTTTKQSSFIFSLPGFNSLMTKGSLSFLFLSTFDSLLPEGLFLRACLSLSFLEGDRLWCCLLGGGKSVVKTSGSESRSFFEGERVSSFSDETTWFFLNAAIIMSAVFRFCISIGIEEACRLFFFMFVDGFGSGKWTLSKCFLRSDLRTVAYVQ